MSYKLSDLSEEEYRRKKQWFKKMADDYQKQKEERIMGKEQRQGTLLAIKEAIRKWNMKTGKPASVIEVRNKIKADLGVLDKTANDYLKTLTDSGEVEYRLSGLWAVQQ